MAAFYGRKIRAGVIKLEDVPKLWRTKTAAWLEQNPAET